MTRAGVHPRGSELPGHDQLEALLAEAAKPPETADLSKMELVVAYDWPRTAATGGGCSACHNVKQIN